MQLKEAKVFFLELFCNLGLLGSWELLCNLELRGMLW